MLHRRGWGKAAKSGRTLLARLRTSNFLPLTSSTTQDRHLQLHLANVKAATMATTTMADIQGIQVEALVVMKIIKHSSQAFPSTATGSLVGMDVNGTLQVTNCFPFPTVDMPASDSHSDSSNPAAAAPRAKANATYQNEMIKFLREVNVDANNVGWYTSTSMGNFVNMNTIENQFFYQKEMNERTVALVHDVSRTSQGALALRAYRLSPSFMTAYRESKFTADSLQKSGLRYQDILVELPLVIHNSHLLTSLLHQLPASPPDEALEFPPTLAALKADPAVTSQTLTPNFDSLDLSIDPFLEKTCDLLLDSIEAHDSELKNHQFYARSLAREQAKISAWQAKRKSENAARAAAKQPPLPEDEYLRLFKLPQEPSRLEIMLNSRQVDQYAKQVDGFTAGVSGKMFAVRSNLLPGENP
ncbi:eukaryotic translation initiation factor 3 subunit 3 [Lineolata rhizophorae]|uniref:Eukaryotic translation initiation factor 3 subunit H n=1 Tax=Lineolata rhizophorae TaxID=578093 RepID=A0A6A6PA13_9PEZI|nr:eukaryotic translation initiation factor 3 subunit 3 [Lineolata rhizophorae]